MERAVPDFWFGEREEPRLGLLSLTSTGLSTTFQCPGDLLVRFRWMLMRDAMEGKIGLDSA